MARSGMTRLIDRVRSLTYAGTAEYSVGTANFWDADHVEQLLDDHRSDIYRHSLTPITEYRSGTAAYYTYASGATEWETTTGGTSIFFVQDSAGSNVSTASYTPDYQRGNITFTTDQSGSAYYVTGRVYDIYAAGASLLEQWAAREARQFEVETPAVRAMRQQKMENLLAMAAQLRGQSSGIAGTGGGMINLYRSDRVY